MNDETWVEVEQYHGAEAVGLVDTVAIDFLADIRPSHGDNYLDSEGLAYQILRSLKRAGFQIVKK